MYHSGAFDSQVVMATSRDLRVTVRYDRKDDEELLRARLKEVGKEDLEDFPFKFKATDRVVEVVRAVMRLQEPLGKRWGDTDGLFLGEKLLEFGDTLLESGVTDKSVIHVRSIDGESASSGLSYADEEALNRVKQYPEHERPLVGLEDFLKSNVLRPALGPAAYSTLAVRPQPIFNEYTKETFYFMAYQSGDHMYPESSDDIAAVKAPTEAVSQAQLDRHVRFMKTIFTLAGWDRGSAKTFDLVSRDRKVVFYNLDGRSALSEGRYHTFSTLKVPMLWGKRTLGELAASYNCRPREIAFIDMTLPLTEVSVPATHYVLAQIRVSDDVAVKPGPTLTDRIPGGLFRENPKLVEQYYGKVVRLLPDETTYFKKTGAGWKLHKAEKLDQFRHLTGLVGARVLVNINKLGRIKYSVLYEAEPLRRSIIEETALQRAAAEMKLPASSFEYHYVPVIDWGAATSEMEDAVCSRARTWGNSHLVVMHCSSSQGRTGGMLQNILACTAMAPVADLSARAQALYIEPNRELDDFERPERAANTASRVEDPFVHVVL